MVKTVNFVESIKCNMRSMYLKDVKESNIAERFNVLAKVLKDSMIESWYEREKNVNNEKEVHYFSMEFLLGKQLKSIILNLGLTSEINSAMQELGWDLEELVDYEPEPSTGNGGLGRLAACFIDSMSSNGIRGYGQGLRYKSGLFKQKIVNGHQKELPDLWLENGLYAWDIRREEHFIVKFRGNVRFETIDGRLEAITENYKPVVAVPYDIPTPGYENGVVNYLRLWNAECPSYEVLDECGINFTNYHDVLKTKNSIDEICDVLYPDDSNFRGKELRLKQEYFMCSAGVQSLVKKFKDKGINLEHLDKHLAIHINDTHPTLCIPEMMRILVDEEKMDWDKAWEVTTKVMSYTNHTIMQEALEKWPGFMLQSLLPRIYMIIQEIDRRYIEGLRNDKGYSSEKIDRMKIIDNNGNIRMANLCIVGSHSVNGVAALHTEILKKDTLKDFYKDEPYKFNNKTNGIAHRRWLFSANPELTEFIDTLIPNSNWKNDLSQLKQLHNYVEDPNVYDTLGSIKYINKVNLANMIKKDSGIEVDPNSIFDIQVKRLHAYKRQLMNLLGILMIYNDLVNDPNKDFYPMTFIFGAKAAAGYHEAKCTIKAIYAVADLVNNDPRVNDKMKVVFIENYNVSKAERIVTAADISEQISTASKEASGTSNMKFMMNGALTLGTMDGANVEIAEYAGNNNIFIFGLQSDEVIHRYNTWTDLGGKFMMDRNCNIKRAMDMLINGSIPGIGSAGFDLYRTLVNNDHFFVLSDLQDYVDTKYRMNWLYRTNKSEWNKRCLINIASSGMFTTDRTIKQYSDEIWFK